MNRTAGDLFPPLAEPPGPGGGWALVEPWLRRAFKLLNRSFMVPVHRAGLGAWVSTPVGGWILLLRTRGRKSGLVRETPLNYLIAEGRVWVLAGFGPRTEWYRNLLVDPAVEVQLPGRALTGTAAEERDPAVRARVIPALVRSTGLPGSMVVPSPWTAPDEAVLDAVAWVPLVRITPDGTPLEAGPDDPGGRAWIWRQALVAAATLLAWQVLRRLARRNWRA